MSASVASAPFGTVRDRNVPWLAKVHVQPMEGCLIFDKGVPQLTKGVTCGGFAQEDWPLACQEP